MSDNLKALVEKLNKAFEDFKAANDDRLSAIENTGHAGADIVAKVEAANADITDIQAKLTEADSQIKAERARSDELELQIARGGTGGSEATDDERVHARVFAQMVAGRDVAESDVDIDQYRNYKKAFEAYVRRGTSVPGEVRAALEVGSDPDGGYWVTPDSSGRIATLVYESSPIRQIAAVQPISTDSLEGINDLDEAGFGWVGERQARPDTDTPQVGEYRIPAHECYAQPKATQKILDDSVVDVEAWLNGKVSTRIARGESTAFVNGDGVAKPRGFLTYGHGVPSKSAWDVVERVPSGAAGAFAASDPGDALIDLTHKVKAVYRNGARWVMNRTSLGESRKLKDGQGNYLWQPDFRELGASTLLGFGITEAEDMPDIAANSLSIAFGNFMEGYQIVDRQGIRVLRDPFTDKPYIKFYTTYRVGGDVINFEAIKLMRFAVAAS